jgi:primosomal protein N'
MKIKEMISQNRRDFSATMECEECGHTFTLTTGYDDRYYHDEVIPNMKCPKCGKSRNDLGIKQEIPTKTRYESWEVV